MGIVNLLKVSKPPKHGTDMRFPPSIADHGIAEPVSVADDDVALERFHRFIVGVHSCVSHLVCHVELPNFEVIPVGNELPSIVFKLQQVLNADQIEQLRGLLLQVSTEPVTVVAFNEYLLISPKLI